MPITPSQAVVDDYGVNTHGSVTVAIAAGAATTVVAPRRARLARIVVTAAAAGSGTVTVYDHATTGSGTILAVVLSTATVGQVFDVQMPAANGLTVAATAQGPAVTVSYSTT